MLESSRGQKPAFAGGARWGQGPASPSPPAPTPSPTQPQVLQAGSSGHPWVPPPEGLRVGEMGCGGPTPALVGDAPAGRARRSPDQRIPAPCQDGVQGLAAPSSPPPREQSMGSLRATGGCRGTGPPHLQWASCTPFHSRCCSRVRCPGSSHALSRSCRSRCWRSSWAQGTRQASLGGRGGAVTAGRQSPQPRHSPPPAWPLQPAAAQRAGLVLPLAPSARQRCGYTRRCKAPAGNAAALRATGGAPKPPPPRIPALQHLPYVLALGSRAGFPLVPAVGTARAGRGVTAQL